ncbi:MAG: hypothetical protein J0I87_06295, partial [Cellulomonas sp.]|nr:hypothetical protein [Cellulomonas sp.]
MADAHQAAGDAPDETPAPSGAPATDATAGDDDATTSGAGSVAARTALTAAVREIELHVARAGWDVAVHYA